MFVQLCQLHHLLLEGIGRSTDVMNSILLEEHLELQACKCCAIIQYYGLWESVCCEHGPDFSMEAMEVAEPTIAMSLLL